jgi:hypothetical protein
MSGLPVTPVLVKRTDELAAPPDERVYYVLARNGLFIGRNHEFFRSCVPARMMPAELVDHAPWLEPAFPKVPRRLFERIVGFFDRIRAQQNSEASVLLAYDREARRVRAVVPEQTATQSHYRDRWDRSHPIGLAYTPPLDLPRSWTLFGDVHSHVDLPAFASQTDVDDEVNSAGLHVVVGRLYKEPPEIWIEAVVDGARFRLEQGDVLGGYRARNPDVPAEWLERVRVKTVGGNGRWGQGS